MGCTHRFRCQSCGYVAEVSGGPDSGFVVATQTMFCRDCDELPTYLSLIPAKTRGGIGIVSTSKTKLWVGAARAAAEIASLGWRESHVRSVEVLSQTTV